MEFRGKPPFCIFDIFYIMKDGALSLMALRRRKSATLG